MYEAIKYCEEYKVKSLYPFFINYKGVFNDLRVISKLRNMPLPWDISLDEGIDTAYFSNSANKIVSPIVDYLLGENSNVDPLVYLADNTTFNSYARRTLAIAIFDKFYTNWSKLYNTLNFEYNPIENYRMEEKLQEKRQETQNNSGTIDHDTTIDETVESTNNSTETRDLSNSTTYGHAITDTEKITFGKTEKNVTDISKNQVLDSTKNDTTTVSREEKIISSGKEDNSVFGFNSENSVPDSAVSSSDNSTNTITDTTTLNSKADETITNTDKSTTDLTSGGSDTTDKETLNSGTDSVTDSGTISINDGGSNTRRGTNNLKDTLDTLLDTSGTSEHTLTRSGNIGVTTSQQMIESERQLWLWNFFKSVFEDVDSIISILIY